MSDVSDAAISDGDGKMNAADDAAAAAAASVHRHRLGGDNNSECWPGALPAVCDLWTTPRSSS